MTISEFYNTVPSKPYARRIQEANPSVFRSLRQFALQGRLPSKGSFVWACITNDLSLAVGKADQHMTDRIEDIVMYLNNCFPVGCWGDEEAVKGWSEERGLVGTMTDSHAIKVAQDSGL